MKYYFNFFLVLLLISCSDQSSDCCDNKLREAVIIDKGIYTVSYNELFEQPNWIEYEVSNRPKNVDRGNMDFYLESGIKTSDNDDYYKNPWDKGHLAPAATFSDSQENLRKTFSFINCAMQIDDLNRGEWAELEKEVRDLSALLGTIKVREESLLQSQGLRSAPWFPLHREPNERSFAFGAEGIPPKSYDGGQYLRHSFYLLYSR